MRLIFFSICVLYSAISWSQKTEVTDTLALDNVNPVLLHSPRKATIRSAIVPGWGQAYNKKYWKIPIVYAGIGTSVYFISWNHKNVQKYKEAVIALNDGDPTTTNTTGEPDAQMQEFLDLHHKWRDLSYFALAGVYVLNILDANVDAHLFYFDVNEDLSVGLRPSVFSTNRIHSGLTLSFNLK